MSWDATSRVWRSRCSAYFGANRQSHHEWWPGGKIAWIRSTRPPGKAAVDDAHARLKEQQQIEEQATATGATGSGALEAPGMVEAAAAHHPAQPAAHPGRTSIDYPIDLCSWSRGGASIDGAIDVYCGGLALAFGLECSEGFPVSISVPIISEKLPLGRMRQRQRWSSNLRILKRPSAKAMQAKKAMKATKVTKASVKAKAMRKPAGKAPAMKSMKSMKAMKKPSAAMPAKKDDDRKKDDDYEMQIRQTDFARYYESMVKEQRLAAGGEKDDDKSSDDDKKKDDDSPALPPFEWTLEDLLPRGQDSDDDEKKDDDTRPDDDKKKDDGMPGSSGDVFQPRTPPYAYPPDEEDKKRDDDKRKADKKRDDDERKAEQRLGSFGRHGKTWTCFGRTGI
ncbi:unnamed protein product [Symbiodinium sp. KB8]|nr:unnamed protein product [Symbiodinium sp. KB8]